ncbi:MAG: ribose 5-phosphate isomerase B [Planctomycetota bacterium]|jgi:ribose 5-phosphate isomerase B
MKIAIGSDHRGFDSKEQIKSIISQLGHEILDVGTSDNNPTDYPDLAYLAGGAVSRQEADMAILVCGTGIGMSIAANKIKNVRAALCHDELTARISRDHNNANVLCISGDLVGEVLLRKIVEAWLNTEFRGGRHQRRIDKITAIEKGIDPRDWDKNRANDNMAK